MAPTIASVMRPLPDELTDAYRECRKISRRHSSSFFLATSLRPAISGTRPVVGAEKALTGRTLGHATLTT